MPEIVILDTGLATELTPAHQASLAEFFQAIINWDGASVARNIIAFSSNLQPSFDPVVAFTSDVTTAVRHFQDSTRAGDCMAAIFETVQRHHVTLDPNVMVAVVTVMVLEGWQFRLDPSINILDYIGDVMRSSFREAPAADGDGLWPPGHVGAVLGAQRADDGQERREADGVVDAGVRGQRRRALVRVLLIPTPTAAL